MMTSAGPQARTPRAYGQASALYLGGGLLACALVAAGIFFAQADHDALRDDVRVFLSAARDTPWALPLVCAFYIVGGAVLFPVTVTNLACAMVFGLWGILYGLIGAMLSAVVFFAAGRHARGRGMDRALARHTRIQAVDRRITGSGVIGVTMLRFVPLAPYSVFNVAAGLSSLSFAVYMAATFLSLAPGAVARGILGDSLTRLFLDPSAENIAYVALGAGLWTGIVVAIHILLKKYRPASSPSER